MSIDSNRAGRAILPQMAGCLAGERVTLTRPLSFAAGENPLPDPAIGGRASRA